MTGVQTYVKRFTTMLTGHACPENASEMAAYMKNLFPFLGIKKPERMILEKEFFSEYGLPAIGDAPDIIRSLWNVPYRECQYSAMRIADALRKKLEPEHLDLLEYLITNKSWWDTVDLVASHLVGDLLTRHSGLIPETNTRWIKSGNIWLQRSALLFQLGYKNHTDRALLASNIRTLALEKEFFITKAIGWILREYSKTDPVWVKQFVNQESLQPLSRREALKVIHRSHNL